MTLATRLRHSIHGWVVAGAQNGADAMTVENHRVATWVEAEHYGQTFAVADLTKTIPHA
jgi:hypothetical protein